MKVLIFDGYAPGDEALTNSHWIARQSKLALDNDGIVLELPLAIRAKLASALEDSTIRGIALFGHGDGGHIHTILTTQYQEPERRNKVRDHVSALGAVYGCDGEPALDKDNIGILHGRWCHAIACNVGLDLGQCAIEAGGSCFVGYDTSITPEFEIPGMPENLLRYLEKLVVVTTLNLRNDIMNEVELKRAVQSIVEQLFEELDNTTDPNVITWSEEPGNIQGIRAFANQLWRSMRVYSKLQNCAQ